jgi:hypothetical protein
MRSWNLFVGKPSISQCQKTRVTTSYGVRPFRVILLRSFLTLCRFRDNFVNLMRNCLLGVQIAGSGPYMDHRYFYVDSEGNGRYSCGLARQAITEFLRTNAEESIFLGDEWYNTLIAFKNNPSVIGFTVEQIVISKLASTGLHLGDFHLPAAQTFAFDTPPRAYQSINHHLLRASTVQPKSH